MPTLQDNVVEPLNQMKGNITWKLGENQIPNTNNVVVVYHIHVKWNH